MTKSTYLFLDQTADGVKVEHHGLEVHAYSLMPNHYHLLVRSPLGNLSRCMRHLNGTYTQRLNLRYGWDGPVFRGRFRSQLVENEEYLDHLFMYVHLNPFEAGLAMRLAVWALSRAQRFSHREIAAALGMSEGQVAKVLWRFRREPPGQPLLEWMEVDGFATGVRDLGHAVRG